MVRKVSSTSETDTPYSPSSYLAPLKDLIERIVKSCQTLLSNLAHRSPKQPLRKPEIRKSFNCPLNKPLPTNNTFVNPKAKMKSVAEIIKDFNLAERKFKKNMTLYPNQSHLQKNR